MRSGGLPGWCGNLSRHIRYTQIVFMSLYTLMWATEYVWQLELSYYPYLNHLGELMYAHVGYRVGVATGVVAVSLHVLLI